MPNTEGTRAVLLDRDGTIFENQGFVNTVADAYAVPFMPGAVGAIANLQALGFKPVIVTNQGGVGRGYLTEGTLKEITEVFAGRLKAWGILAPTFYCPHDPEAGCFCRKPQPLLILQAAKVHDLDLEQSILIGDRDTDVEAGRRAGVGRSYLLTSWAEFDLSRPARYGSDHEPKAGQQG